MVQMKKVSFRKRDVGVRDLKEQKGHRSVPDVRNAGSSSHPLCGSGKR